MNEVYLNIAEGHEKLAAGYRALAGKATDSESTVPEPPVPEPPVPEQHQPTLEEIRAAMADKSRDGHREAVKAIITKYGVNNLSALEPKHYAAALKEVEEIK
ncbi:hypothetical protein J0B03_05745 [Alkalibacter rhizosphaerae]|uniref:rRNA biogenesis protein rrp5 n=1 Tax=Alkalibacter rhizosphaerae TaxID=2815577 RepID=A0A975AIX4_9FIRM|nr:hypothetical protein [Alkalibacter rhizosphaerae]QSX09563.1 hypothetical protein J0B03_05745 [Alkalibacter rhizosphaerae]